MKKTTLILLTLLCAAGIIKAQSIAEPYVESFDADNYIYLLKANIFNSGTNTFVAGSVKLADQVTLVQDEARTDELNTTHYRYHQAYQNIPVENSDFLVHTDADGITKIANGRLLESFTVSTAPGISGNDAIQQAIAMEQQNGASLFAWEDAAMEADLKERKNDPNATYYPVASLVIINASADLANPQYKLVYKMDITVSDPGRSNEYLVNAADGSVLQVKDLSIQCHAGHPATLSKNEVFAMPMSPQKTNTCASNLCDQITADLLYYGNNKIIPSSKIAGSQVVQGNCIWTSQYNCPGKTPVKAIDFTLSSLGGIIYYNSNAWGPYNAHVSTSMFCADKIDEYFRTTHGRNSYDNASSLIAIQLGDGNMVGNSAWNLATHQITLGPAGAGVNSPLTTFDIMGHEFTHGVVQSTANLLYQGESGALNESFADIFGLMVDFYAKPLYTSMTADWIIGNDCPVGTRSFSNPSVSGQPSTYGTGQYWINPASLGTDNGGVHSNSGVQNYMFYLLSQGGSGVNGNGLSYCVTGIGRTQAEKIAYRALTTYVVSTETFMNARAHWMLAASDLYGMNSVQYLQTANAWYAVGVGPYLPTTIPAISCNQQSMTPTYCQGETMLFYSAPSSGSIVSYAWTITECTPGGGILPGAPSWGNGTLITGNPGVLNVLQSWPTIQCGKYYQIKLMLSDGCNPFTSQTMVMHYKCGPAISFTGSTAYRCSNDNGWLDYSAPTATSTTVYELPNVYGAFYSGGASASLAVMNPTPPATTYKVVANNTLGCSAGYWTVNIAYWCRRVVRWTWNNTNGSPIISGMVENPAEADAPGFGQAWYLQELDASTNEPLYTISNPGCWQQPIDQPMTFKGFNPASTDYTDATAFQCTADDGIFQYYHTYRLTRAAWDDEHPYEEFSVILTPTMSLAGNPGFEIIPDDERFRFRKQNMPTGISEINAVAEKLTVYPNPASGIVQVTAGENISRIELFNILGKEIEQRQISISGRSAFLNLADLPKGIYMLNVYLPDGVTYKKILLE